MSISIESGRIVEAHSFQTRVETYASDANEQVRIECHPKHLVVSILDAAAKTFESKMYKYEVRERVYNLSDVRRRIIVL
jgi:phosphoenolpyruvate-protein kinase (PTS system EI component)